MDVEAALPRNVPSARFTRDLAEFAPVLKRSLVAPLYPAPPKQVPKTKPKVVKQTPIPRKQNRQAEVGLRVVGTMIEPNESRAILVDSEGKIQLRAVGDSIETPVGDGQVDKIELKQVTISFEDGTLTLEAP